MVALNNDNEYISGVITLDEIIDLYISENKLPSNYDRFRLFDILVRGVLKVIPFNHFDTKIKYLDVNSLNVAVLPKDYQMYVKVGVIINGRVWALTHNPNIALPREEECGQRIRDIEASNSNVGDKVYFIPHYYNGQYHKTLYGVKGGENIGYFRIDRDNWLIILEGDLTNYTDKIILEYVGTGVKTDGTTTVPISALEVLLAWIDWRVKRTDKTRNNQWDVLEAEKQFGIELDEFKYNMNRFTYVDYVDNFYLTSGQSIKRY